jgi:putative ABC transport system permease protein
MFRNFITIALRNLKRQITYSFINIVGLAVGLACSLVIFLYVYGEWSYDRHYHRAENIYRIGVGFFNMGEFAVAPELLRDYLPKQFDGIEHYTRFVRGRQEDLRISEKKFKDIVYYVDSAFFKVFSYEFVAGDRASVMNSPSSIVMTESMALKFFGSTDAMGRTVEVGKERLQFVVAGIVKDPRHNSHLKSSIWLSLNPKELQREHWSSASVYTYVLLNEQFQQTDLKNALDQIIAKEVYPTSPIANGRSLEEYLKDENAVKFYIHPLRDIYLKSKASFDLAPEGNETNLYIFAVIATFILILAAVNFVNLSTARATRRAKEVGVRKTLGTSKARLVLQFLTESVLTSVIALIVAFGLAEIFTLMFYWITGEPLVISLWTDAVGLLFVFGFTIVVGLIAGIYPAFYLTSFQPVKVLKGNTQLTGSQGFRNVLVTFQFSISITLIICSAVVVRQLNFMSTKDLGFNQEDVVTIDNIHKLKTSAVTLRDMLLEKPGVVNASLHSGEPASKAIISYYTYETTDGKEPLTISTYLGDPNYVDALGMQIIEGRNFSKDLASDTAAIILNESAVRALDLESNPVGAIVNKTQKVIGVVRDFHWESLRSEISPLAIILTKEKGVDVPFSQLAIKVQRGKMQEVLNSVERQWKQLVPEEDFQYHFLDENFGALLKKELVLGKAITFFTILAILISCLGLFGLAAYTTEQRTKEISIRKVLGASVSNIVLLLNRQFTVLVIISMMVATPIAYYACTNWLSTFAFRSELSLWLFPVGGMVGLFLSYLTVSYHTLRASRTNPAETLKGE